ncbi:MAG TPA: c-type cytochrome [Acidobacteriaceae bacterium]|nr:c-type cytochrome [Acidobacteriaceae bacterium]
MRETNKFARRGISATVFLLAATCVIAVGCTGGQTLPTYTVSVGGNAMHGRRVIESKGCGSCHTIPGIHNANGVVGPPLMFFSRRTMIAGELPNSPENLVRWLKNPPSVEPGTDMPDLGLTDQQANDVAAYLYTLR